MTGVQRNRYGVYEVRRVVPAPLRPIIGQANLKRTLSTKDPREAKERAPAVHQEFDEIIRLARAGEWPPKSDAEIQQMARSWYSAQSRDSEGPISDRRTLEQSVVGFLLMNGEGTNSVRRVIDAAVGVYRSKWGDFQPIDGEPTLYKPATDDLGSKLSEVLDAYFTNTNPRPQTRSEWRTVVKRLTEHLGRDPQVNTISKSDVTGFRDAMWKLPRSITKADREKSFPEIIAKADPSARKISKTTVQKAIGALNAVFAWAVNDGKMNLNPAQGVKPKGRSAAVEREAYTQEHLMTIFNSGNFRVRPTKRGARFWLPLIAILSGARMEEIGQLHVADIRREDGVDFFSITSLDDDENGKAVKTDGSKRKVPIHPELIRLGFLDYVARIKKAGPVRLFPDLKESRTKTEDGEIVKTTKAFSKWYARFTDGLGITDARYVFHSFRHNFKTMCRNARLDEEIHDALTGHSGGGVGRDYGDYPLDTLAKAIRKVKPPIRLNHL